MLPQSLGSGHIRRELLTDILHLPHISPRNLFLDCIAQVHFSGSHSVNATRIVGGLLTQRS
ncbi:MAG: hypothetical protein KME59_04370 [Trichormus sp. ATA11-4-KO1]|nr:hypothetical protein [Trichormus sp. ATA11-4-KO1]